MRTNFDSEPGQIASLIGTREPTSRKSVAAIAGIEVFARNKELLQDLAKSNEPSPINGFASLVNYAPKADQPIHRWFWYREGFSVELVKEYIKHLPRGSKVLDPFCGAGTTLLAARSLGFPSVGLDVNPISVLVSRVKTTPISKEVKQQVAAHFEKLQNAHGGMPPDNKPLLSIIDKVFERDILAALLIYRKIIKAIPITEIRELFFVAWLSILERVSNVYKEGNGLKYKNRRRSGSGYIQLNLDSWQTAVLPADKFSFVKRTLVNQIQMMVDDLESMPANRALTQIIESEAETLEKHIGENSIALTIFSPPYCNCFNYFKMYKIELWMGEFVDNYAEMRVLNRRGLRSHVETVMRRKDDFHEPQSEQFASLLDGLTLWDKRIPLAVRGYFIDMSRVLIQLHRALQVSGKCIIVVGNSAYGGVVIPTDSLLAKIAETIGFRIEKLAVARHLTTSSQQRASLGDRMEYLRESLLVLVKDAPGPVPTGLETVAEIPTEDHLRHGKMFLIKNSGLTTGTHKFHRYPGKFIPHIPRWAINRFVGNGKGNTILDPFCGSGTTLVEATRASIRSFGIDVDPIARLVSTVKTRSIKPTKLNKAVENLKSIVSRSKVGEHQPEISTLAHWFAKPAIRDLSKVRTAIERFREDKPIYEFFLVCFTAIIRRVSNADNQTQKTYVSHTKRKLPPAVLPLFHETLRDYSERLAEFSALKDPGKVTILNDTDARCFASSWQTSNRPPIDLIISSPPYLNSVDYIYNQMAEYFWVGDLFGLESQPKQNEYKRNYVGTTKVDARSYRSTPETGVSEIDGLIHLIAEKNLKNAYIVGRYFLDMIAHFKNAAKVLKHGAPYVCVVGDSRVSGETIPVHRFISDCARIAGFECAGSFGYEIRNRHMRFPRMGRGGLVKYDCVIELRNGQG